MQFKTREDQGYSSRQERIKDTVQDKRGSRIQFKTGEYQGYSSRQEKIKDTVPDSKDQEYSSRYEKNKEICFESMYE